MDRDGTGKRTEKRRQNEDDPMDCSSKRTRRQTPGECSSNIAPICAPMASSVCPPGTSAPPEERQQLRGRRRQGALNLERQLVEQGDTFGREFMRDPTIRSPPSSPPRPPPSNIPGMQSPQSSPGGQAVRTDVRMPGPIQELCNQFMDDRFDPLGRRSLGPIPAQRTPAGPSMFSTPRQMNQTTPSNQIGFQAPTSPTRVRYTPGRLRPATNPNVSPIGHHERYIESPLGYHQRYIESPPGRSSNAPRQRMAPRNLNFESSPESYSESGEATHHQAPGTIFYFSSENDDSDNFECLFDNAWDDDDFDQPFDQAFNQSSPSSPSVRRSPNRSGPTNLPPLCPPTGEGSRLPARSPNQSNDWDYGANAKRQRKN